MVRKLTNDQVQLKDVLLELARFVDASAYYNRSDWRLIKIGENIKKHHHNFAFRANDLSIGRKSETPSTMPKVSVFSWREKLTLVLDQTDPIEFMED